MRRSHILRLVPLLTFPAIAAASDEVQLKLLDAALAEHLKDPASAQQYSVSGVRSCDGLTAHPLGAYAPQGCICFAVNAKNSMGGYVGVKYGVASLADGHATIRAINELAFDLENACKAAGMQKRDAAKIAGK